MPYDGLLFDFDGVLADTEPIHWRCWLSALAPYGFQLSWDDYCRHCRGVAARHMREQFERLWPGAATAPGIIESYHAAKDEAFARLAQSQPIPPETVSLLKDLAQRSDLRIGLVTTALRPIVWPVLEASGLENIFAVTVFGHDVAHPKPAPDAYLLASERLGARRAVVFEDTDAGEASARGAGLDVVRVADCRELSAQVRQTLSPA